MMISNTSEYALRAVVQIARMGGGPATAEDIAVSTQVPAGYLARILRDLAKSGILTARRGIGGGFTLARPADEISVWEVMKAVGGGIKRIERCPLEIQGHDDSLCALHSLLDAALAHVEAAFKEASIASILTSSANRNPLCQTREQHDLGPPESGA